MKKLFFSVIIVFVAVVATVAQTDPKAKAILNEVSKKYKSFDIIKTEFTFTLDNPQANIKDTQQGSLYVKANANKYKVVMAKQELISDGKSQWTYLKADKEVQVSQVDNNSDAINPAKMFTIYEKGYKYVYAGETKVKGKAAQLIDLTPIDAKKSFFKIRLTIDKAAKQVVNILIFDKNGNHYTYNVKTFTPNVKVPESIFTFDAKKYPGVEVVDLR